MKMIPTVFTLTVAAGFFMLLAPVQADDKDKAKKVVGKSTDPVYLTCQYNGAPLFFYLTIDYSRRTVVTSNDNVTDPWVDAQGRASQPAQITDSQIVWQITRTGADGSVHAVHFTLNRLTGGLGSYDDSFRGMRFASKSYSCEVAPKPKPKF